MFVLESGFDPSTGLAEQGGRLFGRQSFVGLENGLGRVTLGRQYSPAFTALDPFDATGNADRSAGLLIRKAGAVKPAYEVRFYTDQVPLSKIAGVELEAGYWFGEKVAATSTARKVRRRPRHHPLLYANAAFSGALTTQSVQRDATGGKVRTSGFGAAYDFGTFKPYFAWSQDKESGSVGRGKARSWDLGTEIRIDPAKTRGAELRGPRRIRRRRERGCPWLVGLLPARAVQAHHAVRRLLAARQRERAN